MDRLMTFDFDLEEEIGRRCLVDDYYYLQDIKNRRLYLNSDVDQCVVSDIAVRILQYNREDAGKPYEERTPIILYISSNGGSVDDGFELIDLIVASETPVYTVNLGYQYSMGFLIGIAGHRRFALQNSKFLIHDGSDFSWGTTAKVKDRMQFQVKVEERVKNYILSRTQITSSEYDEKYRVEWYMFADEAKEKGCCDCIIGIDCTLGEIV